MANVMILSEPVVCNDVIQAPSPDLPKPETVEPLPNPMLKVPVDDLQSLKTPSRPVNPLGPAPRRPKRRVRPYYHAFDDPLNKHRQTYHHKKGLAVLCFREKDYCLTNGTTSFVREKDPHYIKPLLNQMMHMNLSYLCVTDVVSHVLWRRITKRLDARHPLVDLPVINLRKEFGECPLCHKNCIRWVAAKGINCLRKGSVDVIPHNEEKSYLEVKTFEKTMAVDEPHVKV